MPPRGYKLQPGCHDCKYSLLRFDFDETDLWFCGLNAGTRPRCGSVQMPGEAWPDRDGYPKVWLGAMKAWDKWAVPRAVSASGLCPNYETEKG